MSNLSSGTGSPSAMPVSYDSNSSRIFSVDVLRGIALLGILLISIWEFGGFSMNEQTGLRLAKKGFDYNLFASVTILFEGKMRALFSLVFGAGMMLFLTRPNQFSLANTHELYIRRQTWLMVFGVFNAFVLLWPGDILLRYAGQETCCCRDCNDSRRRNNQSPRKSLRWKSLPILRDKNPIWSWLSADHRNSRCLLRQ
jgi:uncharacterized membrane protein YeiB